jgi:hypothetical protein
MMPERLLDPLIYLYLVGLIQLLVLGLASLCALFFVRGRGWRWYRRFVLHAAAFAVFLLLFGAIANSAWMLLTYDRWYVSADTVVDFLPFIPFGQWVLDAEFGSSRGHLIGGGSLPLLRALWFALASVVWLSTWLAYRRLLRRAAYPSACSQ